MKPSTAVLNYSSTTATEIAKMGIDAGSVSHIIGLLTDLYSDKEMAVIREYSTNAADSHVEAGQTRPIEVTVTTDGPNPEFTVQDWGLGLSKDEITDVYSMYGTSTKRDSNDAVGMLGLGCKSGLTYAVQFTVDAVKDGMRTVATIAKGEDGVGEIQILLHTSTPEPNGVKVSVPIRGYTYSFYEKVERFFYYWRGGVLVNGEVPENIVDVEEWVEVDPDVYVCGEGYRGSMIVQGGVAYPFTVNRPNDWPGSRSIVAYVPIGSVDFVPSREALHDTDRTVEVQNDAYDFVTRIVYQTFRDELAQCETEWQRLLVAKRFQNLVPVTPRRQAIPNLRLLIGIEDGDRMGWRVTNFHPHADKPELKRSKIHSLWDHIDAEGSTFVYNFSPKSFSVQHWERLKAFGLDTECIVVIPEYHQAEQWGFPGINWNDVPELPRGPRQPKEKTKYPVLFDYNRRTEVDDFPKGQPACYVVTSSRSRIYDSHHYRSISQQYKHEDLQIAVITTTQEAKFNRLFPHVPTVEDWLEKRRMSVIAKLTPDMWKAIRSDEQVLRLGRAVKPYRNEITNSEFKRLLNLVDFHVDKDVKDEIRWLMNITYTTFPAGVVGVTEREILDEIAGSFPLIKSTVRDIMAGYSGVNETTYQHMVAYINAAASL